MTLNQGAPFTVEWGDGRWSRKFDEFMSALEFYKSLPSATLMGDNYDGCEDGSDGLTDEQREMLDA